MKSIAIHLPFLSRYFCKSIALLLAESCIYNYTPPICITIRLPFVSRYFCRSIRVRGRWGTAKKSKTKVPLNNFSNSSSEVHYCSPKAPVLSQIGNENSAQSFSDRSFWKSLRVVDVRAFGSWMSAPKCLFSRILTALTEVLGRDIRANDPRMSAGCPSRKLPLWADFSFFPKSTVVQTGEVLRYKMKGVLRCKWKAGSVFPVPVCQFLCVQRDREREREREALQDKVERLEKSQSLKHRCVFKSQSAKSKFYCRDRRKNRQKNRRKIAEKIAEKSLRFWGGGIKIAAFPRFQIAAFSGR